MEKVVFHLKKNSQQIKQHELKGEKEGEKRGKQEKRGGGWGVSDGEECRVEVTEGGILGLGGIWEGENNVHKRKFELVANRGRNFCTQGSKK